MGGKHPRMCRAVSTLPQYPVPATLPSNRPHLIYTLPFVPCYHCTLLPGDLPAFLPFFLCTSLVSSVTSSLCWQLARTHNHTCFACGIRNENWNDCFPLVEGDNTGGAACKPPVYTYWLLGSPVLWGSDVSEVA